MDHSAVQQLSWLVARQIIDDANPGNSSSPTDQDTSCVNGNDYDGKLGVRISAISVILIGGFFGAWFPTFAARRRGISIPTAAFFIAKYFGSGVIIATAFIHVGIFLAHLCLL